ncbi:MAG: SpaA isopeptide-forming pilin-related protein [Oscillospiraceae bacterium]
MKSKWILTAWCLVFLLLAAPSHILAAGLREPPATEQLGEVPAEKPGISPLAEGSVEQGAVWDFGSYITVKNTKGQSKSIWGYHPMTLNGKTAYCIDPPASVGSGYTQDESADAWAVLSQGQKYAIGLILAYGYPNNEALAGIQSTAEAKTVATQFLIWEVIMGYRSVEAPYGRTNGALYEGVINPTNQGPFQRAYQAIAAALETHREIPSFAGTSASSAPTVTLERDPNTGLYTKTVTDTRGVLESFSFSTGVAGIQFQVSGSSLTVTATADAAKELNGSQLAGATGSSLAVDPEKVVAIWSSASGGQAVCILQVAPGPAEAYFKLAANLSGTATIQKTADSGDVEGYCFKIYRWGSNTSWYGKTDSSGKVYLTDSGYNQNGAKNYTFEGMLDGEYSFLEVLSRKGTGNVFPDSWTITVTDTAGKTVYDKTFIAADFITDDNGDYRLNKISVTGLTGGGNMTMTIHNAPVPADLEILKTSEDGKVSGITFTVEEWAPGIGYCRIGRYTTDESGKILVPKLYVGTKYRLTETVPEGYIGEAPKEITIQAGTNTVTFENRPIYGNLELTKIDESNPEIKLSGAEFTVTREISSEDPSLGSAIREQVMPEVLDADGHGTGVYRLEHLRYGHYTIRETKAPEGYELSNEVFTIDITEDGKTYTVSSSGFDGVPNRQQVGSVQVKKVDPEGNPLAGVSFLLEYSQDGKNWKSVTFREEGSLPTLGGCTSAGLTDGVLVTGEDGTALFSGLCISIGDNHTYYRLTETAAPEGYSLLAKPAFEGELPQDGSRDITVTAVNSSQYMLPFTGNIGFTTVTFGLLLTELALCAVVFLFRKKKQEG